MQPLFLKITAIILLALAALSAGILYSRHQANVVLPPTGAQDHALGQLLKLSLPDAQGQQTALSQWQGRILVVNFWATWCPPCKREMPAFSRLQQKFGEKGVQFVGIAVDNAENVQKFSQTSPVSYPLLIGGNQASQLTRDLGNSHMGLPFTLIIGRQGQIFAYKLGELPETQLEQLLQDALRQATPG